MPPNRKPDLGTLSFVPQLNKDTISDLFFNHEHPAYSKLYERTPESAAPSEREIEQAITEDASSFINCLSYNSITENTAQGPELRSMTMPERDEFTTRLVNDFMNRL